MRGDGSTAGNGSVGIRQPVGLRVVFLSAKPGGLGALKAIARALVDGLPVFRGVRARGVRLGRRVSGGVAWSATWGLIFICGRCFKLGVAGCREIGI